MFTVIPFKGTPITGLSLPQALDLKERIITEGGFFQSPPRIERESDGRSDLGERGARPLFG